MKGTINCIRCGTVMNPQTGVCDKCHRSKCVICLYWKGPRKFSRDKQKNIPLGYDAALDQLIAMNLQIKAGTFNPSDWLPESAKQTRLDALITLWLSECEALIKKGELSHGTLHAYRSRSKKHIIPLLGQQDISRIGTDALNDFKKALPETIRIKTRREVLHTLHTFMVWCVLEARVIQAVPIFPKIRGNDSTPQRALSPEQRIQALLCIPAEHRDFYELEMRMGIRPGETCALKVKDALIDLGAIRVQRSFSMRKLQERDKEEHKMLIALTKRTTEIITKHVQGKEPEDFLFINPVTGRHYTVHRTELYWKRWSGTDVTHYEGTRHSSATGIADMFDGRTAQRLLRHADYSSTQKYIHEAVSQLRVKLEQYDQTLPAELLRNQDSGVTSEELQEVNGGRGWESNSALLLFLLSFLKPTE